MSQMFFPGQDDVCATCAHWASAMYAIEEYGDCGALRGESGKPVSPGQLAYADDYESHMADLKTKPEFGCKCHKRRTQ